VVGKCNIYEAPDPEQREFGVKYLITSSLETNYQLESVFICGT
jgi:hypothetical protein